MDYKANIRLKKLEKVYIIVIVLVCDAVFYGKRSDMLGTLVFKDIIQKQVLIWKYIDSETIYSRIYTILRFRLHTTNYIGIC